ncbi:MAG: VpsF family polysaccharide biosynthesis protein [Xanthobacteraceae bacterium]|nr:VpsF family polysaccharide biosynthesis protein [Xanthobacteraceae bacterium]
MDLTIVGLAALAVLLLLTVSSSLLTNFHIHYVSAGGMFFEKLHAATYLVLLALTLCMVRHGDPIGDLLKLLSQARLTLVLVLCWFALLAQLIVLKRPFTPIIDTFLLPPLIFLMLLRLSPPQKHFLASVFHAGIFLNVALGYYEYFSGHRLIPLTVGNVVVLGEWRSAALLGHPLTASGLIAAYLMALIMRPAILPPSIRLTAIAFCFPSLMVFGGRTALITTIAVVGILVFAESIRLMRGKRTSLLTVIASLCLICVVTALIVVALGTGVFDKMLLRFSSDKGSALARFATLHFLSYLDWHELLFGAAPDRITSLQSQLGLNYGIENFWVSCVAQFGIVHTALMTIGLMCFFADLARRSHPGIWAIFLLLLMIAASSVSFSSKNIQLAQFIVLIVLLLPKERPASPVRRTQPSFERQRRLSSSPSIW